MSVLAHLVFIKSIIYTNVNDISGCGQRRIGILDVLRWENGGYDSGPRLVCLPCAF
jgi:hypothetical protein